MNQALLRLSISVDYPALPHVVRDVELEVGEGEIIGLAGQSGSGKSTIALAILRLLNHRGGTTTGSIDFRGRDLLGLSEREMREIRGREIAFVLQNAAGSLNPALRIGTQIAEAWRAHERGSGWKNRGSSLFKRLGLPWGDEFLHRYPRQLSQGQAQRVLIAMSLLHRPRLLVADEPTSALDVITQADLLGLLRELGREMNMGALFISHDLLTLASVCDRLAILASGCIVENQPVELLFRRPRHPYTRALLEAIPVWPGQRQPASPEPAPLVTGLPASSLR
jgi:ABC-type glutathione transport system ATPase component